MLSAKFCPFCVSFNVLKRVLDGYLIMHPPHALTESTISMTSSNGTIFRVPGHLCGEFTGHRSRWILHTKASDAALWFFFDLRLNERLSKQSRGWWFETPAGPIWRHSNVTHEYVRITDNLSCISLCPFEFFNQFWALTKDSKWYSFNDDMLI